MEIFWLKTTGPILKLLGGKNGPLVILYPECSNEFVELLKTNGCQEGWGSIFPLYI